MTLNKNSLIVVTGGAGFIGSCILRYLNDQGYRNLIVVDDLGTSEKWKNLVGKFYLDFIPKQQLFQWLEGRGGEIDAFIHLGACSSTVEQNATYLMENNYRFSTRLAAYALEHGHRFIYASSAATYGDGGQGFVDNEAELEKLAPLNMYGYSKHQFDLWLKQQGVLKQTVGLKYFNVFGPNEWHKGRMASAILHFMNQIQKEGSVRLFKSSEPEKYTDGGQMRDFIYVKDVVSITCQFLSNKAGGIFNVGTGKPETWNTLTQLVFTGLQRTAKIDYIDMPADLKGKYQNYTAADTTRLKEALGGALTFTPFKTAVIDYVQNYLIPHRYL